MKLSSVHQQIRSVVQEKLPNLAEYRDDVSPVLAVTVDPDTAFLNAALLTAEELRNATRDLIENANACHDSQPPMIKIRFHRGVFQELNAAIENSTLNTNARARYNSLRSAIRLYVDDSFDDWCNSKNGVIKFTSCQNSVPAMTWHYTTGNQGWVQLHKITSITITITLKYQLQLQLHLQMFYSITITITPYSFQLQLQLQFHFFACCLVKLSLSFSLFFFYFCSFFN